MSACMKGTSHNSSLMKLFQLKHDHSKQAETWAACDCRTPSSWSIQKVHLVDGWHVSSRAQENDFGMLLGLALTTNGDKGQIMKGGM